MGFRGLLSEVTSSETHTASFHTALVCIQHFQRVRILPSLHFSETFSGCFDARLVLLSLVPEHTLTLRCLLQFTS